MYIKQQKGCNQIFASDFISPTVIFNKGTFSENVASTKQGEKNNEFKAEIVLLLRN